jgi:hypothetical protein
LPVSTTGRKIIINPGLFGIPNGTCHKPESGNEEALRNMHEYLVLFRNMYCSRNTSALGSTTISLSLSLSLSLS